MWLHKPLVPLGDDKPIDVLARGDYRRLSALVAELENPPSDATGVAGFPSGRRAPRR